MIPSVIKNFLEDDASVAVAATRDKDLVPRVHRVSGWIVSEDSERITCSLPEAFSDGLILSLEENRWFALTAEQIGPHTTYQFKGEYVDSGPCNSQDMAAFEKSRHRFGRVVTELFGLPEENCRASVMTPVIAVTFQVREIYLQTPGPAAGTRIVPAEEGE